MTTGTDGVTLPIDTSKGTPAEVRLRATTNEGLLTAYAALTHRIHAAEQEFTARCATRALPPRAGEVARNTKSIDLRAQRDLVHAEIISRMQP